MLFYHIDPVSVCGVVVATAAMERGRAAQHDTQSNGEEEEKQQDDDVMGIQIK